MLKALSISFSQQNLKATEGHYKEQWPSATIKISVASVYDEWMAITKLTLGGAEKHPIGI